MLVLPRRAFTHSHSLARTNFEKKCLIKFVNLLLKTYTSQPETTGMLGSNVSISSTLLVDRPSSKIRGEAEFSFDPNPSPTSSADPGSFLFLQRFYVQNNLTIQTFFYLMLFLWYGFMVWFYCTLLRLSPICMFVLFYILLVYVYFL